MRGRFGKEEADAVLEVLAREELSSFYKSYLGGRKVRELEELFAEYHGVKHAISVSSGTAGLHCAYLSIGLRPGDEVITTPYTFVSTASMIVACGAEPVFVDIDPKTYCIDPSEVDGAVTESTKAIVPVHLLGHPANMDPILEISEKYGLRVIEDCAQALGATYKGRRVGTMGDIGVFSGQETKTVTFGGEGGMILTNNDKLAERCHAYRNHGEKYAIPRAEYVGFNYRLTELQAAIGVEQFKNLDDFIITQRRNSSYLMHNLPKGISPPYISPDVLHPFWILGCQYNAKMGRKFFIEAVTGLGLNKLRPGATIGSGYTELLYDLPALSLYKRPCPIAEGLLKTSLWIDIHRLPATLQDMRDAVSVMKEVLE